MADHRDSTQREDTIDHLQNTYTTKAVRVDRRSFTPSKTLQARGLLLRDGAVPTKGAKTATFICSLEETRNGDTDTYDHAMSI